MYPIYRVQIHFKSLASFANIIPHLLVDENIWVVEGLYCKRQIECLASSEILTPPPTARRVCVLCTPPPLWCGGRTHSLGGEGVGVNSSEDARHCSVLYIWKYFVIWVMWELQRFFYRNSWHKVYEELKSQNRERRKYFFLEILYIIQHIHSALGVNMYFCWNCYFLVLLLLNCTHIFNCITLKYIVTSKETYLIGLANILI